MRRSILPLTLLCLLPACANVDTRAEPKEQREFVTGSNIPRRDATPSGVAVMSREELERVQRQGVGAVPPHN